MDLTRAKNSMEYEGDGDNDCVLSCWNGLQKSGNETGETGDQRKKRDHSDSKIVKYC